MESFQDLGKYCTYKEAVHSDTAKRKGVDNTPSLQQYENLVTLYKKFYEPLCQHYNKKIPFNSFFRNVLVNKLIGGSKTSQHMALRGAAIDLDPEKENIGISNKSLFDYIRKNMDFDQMILEAPDKFGNPQWVHVSFVSKEKNRKQCLKMTKDKNGESIYTLI